jgi:FkbM family methyltransferase
LAISRFGDFQVAFRSGTADERVLQDSFDHDIFFPGIPEYMPRSDHVILDVGAHIGTFTLLAARKVPQGKVYAVEASRETCDYLKTNIALNQVENVDVSHLALSGRAGEVTLHHDPTGNWGHSITQRLSGRNETVSAESLPNFLVRKHITRCHLAKFNCEGAEFPILLNTPAETLRHFDLLLVLYHCDLATDYRVDDLLTHLREASFDLTIRHRSRARGWLVAKSRRAAPLSLLPSPTGAWRAAG